MFGDGSKDGTYEIKELYNTFTEDELKEIDKLVKNNSLSPIKQESPAIAVTQRDLLNLILLNFFSEYGSPKRLKSVCEKFYKNSSLK